MRNYTHEEDFALSWSAIEKQNAKEKLAMMKELESKKIAEGKLKTITRSDRYNTTIMTTRDDQWQAQEYDIDVYYGKEEPSRYMTITDITKRYNILQRELAEKSGLNTNTLSSMNRGRRRYDDDTMQKIADALKVNISELIKKEEAS